jgi:hypothetical protein
MSSFTTVPSPMITNQPATLTYTNPLVNPTPANQYVLKNASNTNVSNILIPTSINTTFSTNIGNYSSSSSYTLVHPNGNIYTSMQTSSSSGNGCIQITNSSGVSSLYLQFVTSTIPGPNPNGPPQYPTGLSLDTAGNLYFLVYGNNNVYKITNINSPSTSLQLYSTITTTGLSAPYDMKFDSNDNLYVSSTNPPHYVVKVASNGTKSVLIDLTEPSYGVVVDNNNNLYIGLSSGKILKYNLTTNTLTNPFITISGQGTVYGISYNSYTNSLFVNTSSTNIYSISLNTNTYSLLVSSSGIIGGLGVDPNNTRILYGTTNTNIIKIVLPSTYIFTNLVLSNYGNNYLTVNNITTNSVVDTINVNNINPLTSFNCNGEDIGKLFVPIILGTPIGYNTKYMVNSTDLSQIFASYTSGTKATATGYTVTGYGDLNNIFAKTVPTSYTITGTGNTSTTISGYNVVTFINNGTIIFTTPSTIKIGYIIVGGGGSGGQTTDNLIAGGGGGVGGGVNYASFANSITNLTSTVTYNITIGSGGVNGNGQNSTLDSLLSASGGTIGYNSSTIITPGITTSIAGGGTTTSGYGGSGSNTGGTGPSFTVEIGSYSFSGGGGGGAYSGTGGLPGQPGGGNGGGGFGPATNGQPNTGGGGGGAQRTDGTIGADGGSGIVILFFL